MLADRRLKIREIADIVDISTECIQYILHEKLGMTKLSASRVSHLLKVKQKRNRMTTPKLDMFKRKPKEFLQRFVTIDETWDHHYMPEMKEQWTSAGERASKKAKTVPLAGKITATTYFGICKSSTSPTIWRSRGQSRGTTMLIYCADWRLN